MQTPELFRKWAGISIVASAAERRIWGYTKGSRLYPNLYVILVGTPGVGKSTVLSATENLLRRVKSLFVAPSSLTTASLADTVAMSTGPDGSSSLQIIASELGVFLPAYDAAFLNTLTKLYDGEYYEERRRSSKVTHLVIDRPLLSILGGTTPGYLHSFLPDGAWEQGFTARTIFVFSNEKPVKPIWGADGNASAVATLGAELLEDLAKIAKLSGEMTWTDEAKDQTEAWSRSGMPPAPPHPKLEHYRTRRMAHFLKLSMIAALAHSSSLRVDLDDLATARSWLLEAEHSMADIFGLRPKTIEGEAIQETMEWLRKRYATEARPISEHHLVGYLRDRVPAQNISKIIEIMERGHDIRRIIAGGFIHIIPN